MNRPNVHAGHATRPAEAILEIDLGEHAVLAATGADAAAHARTVPITSALAVVLRPAVADGARPMAMAVPILPCASQETELAADMPLLFVDRACTALVDALRASAGPDVELEAVLVGAADPMVREDAEISDELLVGARNLEQARTTLSALGVAVHAEETRGTRTRLVAVDAATGRVHVRSPGRAEVVL